MSAGTPEQVLKSIVDGINTGNLDALMTLYEADAGFAGQPGSLAHGSAGVRQGLAGFIAMKGTLDLEVTRVLQANDLALVLGMSSFTGTRPDGGAVNLTDTTRMSCVVRQTAPGALSSTTPRERTECWCQGFCWRPATGKQREVTAIAARR